MSPVNSNITNVSAEGKDSVFIQEQTLEVYTVVLSLTAHVLSVLFGGVNSLLVCLALTTQHNINNALLLFPLNVCITCNFLWSPVEIADLIMFHCYHKHPGEEYLSHKTGLYVFSIILISFTIAFLSLEEIIHFKNFFGPLLKKTWSLCTFPIAVLASVLFMCVFMIPTSSSVYDSDIVYVSMDKLTRSLFLALIALAFCLVATTMVILLLLFTKEIIYWEHGRPCLKLKTMELPEFLLSQSTACDDIDGRFIHGSSDSSAPSPTMPKLLTVGDPETSSKTGEDSSHISDLRASKPMGNRPGINMAQVLGQRRHTICNISSVTTPVDLISRAKQYNYVRKFSVDIAALQAQLQNPKIFTDAPYQSAIDLSKKQPADNSHAQISKTLRPLKPLHGNLEEEKTLDDDNIWVESEEVSINLSPSSPLIASDGDAPAREDNIPIEVQNFEETLHEENKPNAKSSGQAQKPTMLNVDATAEDIFVSTLESATATCSNMVRLTLYLSLTFVLSMLPLLVTEMFSSSLSSHAFINISTCMLALSTIQTIVYPRLIVSSDAKVRRNVRMFKVWIKRAAMCKRNMDTCHHSEDISRIV